MYIGLRTPLKKSRQIEWHKKAIGMLHDVHEDMHNLELQLKRAKLEITETFQGVEKQKKTYEVSRAKKENKRKSKARQLKRDKKNSTGLANKICKVDNVIKITEADLKDDKDIMRVIRPVLDLKYMKLLKKDKAITDSAYTHVIGIMNLKKKKPKKKAIALNEPESDQSEAINEDSEINEDEGDSEEDEEVNLNISLSEDSDVDLEDPFDFIDVQIVNSDGELESI